MLRVTILSATTLSSSARLSFANSFKFSIILELPSSLVSEVNVAPFGRADAEVPSFGKLIMYLSPVF